MFIPASVLFPDCSMGLSQIKSLKIVKKAGDTYGSWFKDPSEGSAKVSSFFIDDEITGCLQQR